MATAEELLNSVLKNEASVLSASDAVFVIDGESRTINVPDSERLFGVEGDKDVERKYFQCPKIVGDNIDLSQHQIYVSYAFTTTENSTSFPDADGLYHCEDVEVSGDNITFSWLLSGNVFANPGFIAFKVMAKKSEGEELKTKWNTAPAIGSVLLTVPDGEEIAEEYPDIINQLLTKMESVEQIATPEAMQGYVNAYLEENPVTGGMTEEQKQQLNQNTTDIDDLKNELPYVDASIAVEMTNEKRIYRYTGSEEGYVTGSLYYHDGTKWVQIGEEKKIEVNEELNSVDLWKNSVELEKETTAYIDKETTKVINNDPDNYYVWMVMYNSSGNKFGYRTEDGKTPTIKNGSNSITNFDYTKYQNDGYNYKILISRRDSKTITLSMALSAVSIIKEYTEKITEYLLPVSQKNTQDIRELKTVLVEDGGIKGNNLADSSVTESKIADKAITPNKTSFFSYEHIETKNLFDSTKIKEGVWLNGNTGYKDSSSTPTLEVVCTDYIPVTPGLKYLNLRVSSDGWWYNSDLNPLQKCSIVYNQESFNNQYVYSFGIAPENAAYLSCNVPINQIDTFMIWQGENAQGLIWESGSKYEYKFTDDGIRSLIMSVASAGVNNLQGKTWLVIGDSITNFPNGSYRQLIAETYGATVLSAYADGRRVSFGADKQPNYCTPYLFSQGNMPSQKPDIITILLGTNDYGNDSPIGNISDDENSQSVDSYSFIGCYKWMLKQLHDKYGHVPIILITPFHRKNGNTENGATHTLVDYAHAIKEIGEYYSYPVCDMYSESGLPVDMFDGYTNDGLHLTADSHTIVAPKIYKIMNEQLSTI